MLALAPFAVAPPEFVPTWLMSAVLSLVPGPPWKMLALAALAQPPAPARCTMRPVLRSPVCEMLALELLVLSWRIAAVLSLPVEEMDALGAVPNRVCSTLALLRSPVWITVAVELPLLVCVTTALLSLPVWVTVASLSDAQAAPLRARATASAVSVRFIAVLLGVNCVARRARTGSSRSA